MKTRSQHRSMRQDIHREPSRYEWRFLTTSHHRTYLKRQSAKFTRVNADDFIQEGLADREDQIRMYGDPPVPFFLVRPWSAKYPPWTYDTGWNSVQSGVFNHAIPR